MKIRVSDEKIEGIASEIMVLGIFEGEKRLKGKTAEIDKKLNGIISQAVREGDIKGKFRETLILRTQKRISSKRLMLIGLGKEKEFTLEKLRQVFGTIARTAKNKEFATCSTLLHGKNAFKAPPDETAQAAAEGILLSLFEVIEFKTENKKKKEVKEFVLVGEDKKSITGLKKGIQRAAIICRAANLTRTLVAYPSNKATPTFLSKKAREIAREHHLKCRVISKPEAEKLGMNAFLGVARGSLEPPKFIILEHHPGKKNADTIVLVGKGITFDSGGISLKPGQNMDEMKEDMGGGAAVLGAMKAAAGLRIPLNVIGIVPATENLPSGSALKPGDILRSYSGKTIEVLNTDAEGRLVLSDALSYAQKYKPKAIVDLATLTGACEIALGSAASGMMGNDEKLISRIKEAGEKTGERVWQLPLWEDYDELIKSDIADVKNLGGRAGGAITAAAFLKKFVGDVPWVHLDIAATVWTRKDKPYLPKGPTGVGVRLLIELLRSWG